MANIHLKRVSCSVDDAGPPVMMRVVIKTHHIDKADKIKRALDRPQIGGFVVESKPDIIKSQQDYIKLEMALHQLTGKIPVDYRDDTPKFFGAPVSILTITATALPIFLRLFDEDKTSTDCFVVRGSEEYVGFSLNDMEPAGGEFLVHNELRAKNSCVSHLLAHSLPFLFISLLSLLQILNHQCV